jgi:hypothetical protein
VMLLNSPRRSACSFAPDRRICVKVSIPFGLVRESFSQDY